VEKPKSQIDNLVDLDPIPLAPTPDAIDVENQVDPQNNIQNADEAVDDQYKVLGEQ
jgi:hypothetical protein